MAFTVSFVTDSVMGKYRTRVHDVTPDATTGSFDTGLSRVAFAIVTYKSMATYASALIDLTRNLPVMAENALAVGTAAAGYIGLTGCVANDVYRVVSFGRS